MAEICFDTRQFYMYFFIFVVFTVYFIYINKNEKYSEVNLYQQLSNQDLLNKISELQQDIFNIKLKTQSCDRSLQACQQERYNGNIMGRNPSIFGNEPTRNQPSYDNYTLTGYLSGGGNQYPVYSREKYPGRSDKLEYYLINESRNKLKIPFKTVNYNELQDGDTITIPEIGDNLVYTLYDIKEFRYDPRIF